MFNHLFATILICLGVANTTPISNYNKKESNLVLTTPKKQNISTNYTINLDYQSVNRSADYTTEPIENTYYQNSGFRMNERYNISQGNNYLNILGNIYRTQVASYLTAENNQQIETTWIENKDKIGNNLDYLYQRRTEMVYVYKITPYNYNVETNITLKINITMYDWESQNNVEWYTYQNYLIKNTYTTTQENWDQYINQQITNYQAYNIARDIENIDNGFYYVKTQQLIQIGQGTTTTPYTDEFEINIIPNVNNYIVIEYIPTARAVDMGGDQNLELMIPRYGTGIIPGTGNKITGTNIIPDGTYEVVDIPGLMFEVIGMPFAFVSQAFNLTLFPGTPYQINIANLFLSIIAIFVFVWLLMIFIKMKSGG